MAMKKYLTWFRNIDTYIWKENVESNNYYATICIMIAALIGAMDGGRNILYEWFDLNLIRWEPIVIICTIIELCASNIGESIIACRTIAAAIGRSLLVCLAIVLAYAVGYVTAIVVIVIICIYLVLFAINIFGAMLGGAVGSGSAKSYRLEDGTEVKQTGSGLFGERHYKDNSGNRYTSRDGGNSATMD